MKENKGILKKTYIPGNISNGHKKQFLIVDAKQFEEKNPNSSNEYMI